MVTHILDELSSLGIELEVDGDRLLCRPASLLTADLRARIRAEKEELLRALRGQETPHSPFNGLPEIETAPILPQIRSPGKPPQRGCYCCSGRGFHKVEGGPEWVCSTCHPPELRVVVEEWTAPEPSLVEAMRRRKERVERLGVRGMGKRQVRAKEVRRG